MHESLLTLAEYAPAPQGVHTRSVVLVPFEETYSPAVQEVHAEHDGGLEGGNSDSVTSVFLNSPVGHPATPQRTPLFVLVRAMHGPTKGETVQGLEEQVVGLMYLSAPPLPSFPKKGWSPARSVKFVLTIAMEGLSEPPSLVIT